jgi:hypothetical protein
MESPAKSGPGGGQQPPFKHGRRLLLLEFRERGNGALVHLSLLHAVCGGITGLSSLPLRQQPSPTCISLILMLGGGAACAHRVPAAVCSCPWGARSACCCCCCARLGIRRQRVVKGGGEARPGGADGGGRLRGVLLVEGELLRCLLHLLRRLLLQLLLPLRGARQVAAAGQGWTNGRTCSGLPTHVYARNITIVEMSMRPGEHWLSSHASTSPACCAAAAQRCRRSWGCCTRSGSRGWWAIPPPSGRLLPGQRWRGPRGWCGSSRLHRAGRSALDARAQQGAW